MTHENAPSMTLPRECCISPEDLVVRLAEARAAVDNENVMLAFDADGTLWSGDVGNDLFYALTESQAVRKDAYSALVREAKAFGIAYSGNATKIAQTLFEAYEAGRYAEERCFAMMAWVFAGFTLQETIDFSHEVAKQTNLAGRLHRFLDPIFAWSQQEDVPVWVVSASPQWMVEIGAALFGIPSERVIGMLPGVANGVIQPELDGVPVYGSSKPIHLFTACLNTTLLGGFGDSSYDVPLLKMAKVPVAVRPKPGLVACIQEMPNCVAIGL